MSRHHLSPARFAVPPQARTRVATYRVGIAALTIIAWRPATSTPPGAAGICGSLPTVSTLETFSSGPSLGGRVSTCPTVKPLRWWIATIRRVPSVATRGHRGATHTADGVR